MTENELFSEQRDLNWAAVRLRGRVARWRGLGLERSATEVDEIASRLETLSSKLGLVGEFGDEWRVTE